MSHIADEMFEADRAYLNVYFLFVDAKGHSNLVRTNDEENVFRVFDRFEDEVMRRCDDAASRESCEIASRWGWAGDGGLLVFYNPQEGNARRAALRASREILMAKEEINRWIGDDGYINGEIHIRISVHKGSLRFRSSTGSIHSTAINLAAHAEKAAPSDSLVISSEVFRLCSPEEQEQFTSLDVPLEGENFYVRDVAGRSMADLQAEWRASAGPPAEGSGISSDISIGRLGLKSVYSQRAATAEYAKRIEDAKVGVDLLGTSLSGFLADHRDLIDRRLTDGIRLRVLLPSDQIRIVVRDEDASLPAWRASTARHGSPDDAQSEWSESVRFFTALQQSHPDRLEVRYYTGMPSGAILAIDDIVFFSPFLAAREGLKTFTIAADGQGIIGIQLRDHFDALWGEAV